MQAGRVVSGRPLSIPMVEAHLTFTMTGEGAERDQPIREGEHPLVGYFIFKLL